MTTEISYNRRLLILTYKLYERMNGFTINFGVSENDWCREGELTPVREAILVESCNRMVHLFASREALKARKRELEALLGYISN